MTTKGSDDTEEGMRILQFCMSHEIKRLVQNFRNTKDSVVFVYGHARTGMSTGHLFMDTDKEKRVRCDSLTMSVGVVETAGRTHQPSEISMMR
jgi:hypothetical protein